MWVRWNSWNHFYCGINEDLIKQTADALVNTGLAKLGYEYVNIDDCWAESDRDYQGNFVANRQTFPSGIKALADYVHAKGWCELQNPANHRVFERKLRPRPSG